MTHFRGTIVPVILAISIQVAQAAAEEPNKPPDKADLFRFLLDGMKTNRMQLQQGAFRAHGRRVLENSKFGRVEGPVEIYSAFDFAAAKMRFDRREPERIWDRKKAGEWKAGEQGGKFIRTPREMIEQKLGDKLVGVFPGTRPPDQWAKPFERPSPGARLLARSRKRLEQRGVVLQVIRDEGGRF